MIELKSADELLKQESEKEARQEIWGLDKKEHIKSLLATEIAKYNALEGLVFTPPLTMELKKALLKDFAELGYTSQFNKTQYTNEYERSWGVMITALR